MMKNILALTILVFAFGQYASAQSASKQNFYPPNARPYGVSQTEWNIRWTRWVFSVPDARNPLNDTTGEFCDENQSGPVYFLSSAWLIPGGTFIRHCTIPSNRAVYVPVTGTFCSPFTDGTTTPEETEECARTTVDGAVVEMQLDGREVNFQNHRFDAGPLNLDLPDDNILSPWGLPSEAYVLEDVFTDYYAMMLPPMSVGEHTIHIHGEYSQYPGFFWDITYNLTVVPAKGPSKAGLLRRDTKPVF